MTLGWICILMLIAFGLFRVFTQCSLGAVLLLWPTNSPCLHLTANCFFSTFPFLFPDSVLVLFVVSQLDSRLPSSLLLLVFAFLSQRRSTFLCLLDKTCICHALLRIRNALAFSPYLPPLVTLTVSFFWSLNSKSQLIGIVFYL